MRCWRSAIRPVPWPRRSAPKKSLCNWWRSILTIHFWQRDLSVAQEKIGDVEAFQGDAAGALQSFRDSLAIAERLAKSDPSNVLWQTDVVQLDEELGDAALAQGQLSDALKSYSDGLAIAQRVAQANPGNDDLQRELAASYGKVGDAQFARGDLSGADHQSRSASAIFDAAGQNPIRTMLAGSTTCRLCSKGSAMCRWRRAAILRARLRSYNARDYRC